ncbi:MAG: glucosyl-3-phosphoglycerate synthase [Thermoleophilaceae bacterium]
MIRTFGNSDHTPRLLRERKQGEVTVVLPALNEAITVGGIVAALRELDGLVDQVLVIDGSSEDGTADRAREAGAEVYDESELMPEFGPARGKGDALWRSLSVARGDYVVFLDSDTLDFSPHFALGLIAPLIAGDGVSFVKGAFSRPFVTPDGERPNEGGRVTELCARPLLAAFYPPLAGFGQPLAGEVAARRDLLQEVPFATDFGVEIGMLIDVYERFGLDVMAQVDLGERRNQHQSLFDLGRMAYTVQAAVLRRLRDSGRLAEEELPPLLGPDGRVLEVAQLERPPFASVRSAA